MMDEIERANGWNSSAFIKSDGRLPDFYECDPEKNTVYGKNVCQELCFYTTRREFATEEAIKEAERMEENAKKDI